MVFNPFRLLGDGVHFLGKSVLLYEVITSHDCRGVSFRTQLLYMLLFVCRYVDLLTVFVSWYNTLMKGFYIAASVVICAVVHIKLPRQPAGMQGVDSVRSWTLALPSLGLAMVPVYAYFRHNPSVPAVMEFLWYFSVTLEAVAMVPQYVVMHKMRRDMDAAALSYIVLQGSYRGLYIANWALRRWTQPWYWMPYLWACGVTQFGLFCVYFGTWTAGRYMHHIEAPKLPEVAGEELEEIEVLDAPLLASEAAAATQRQQQPQQQK